MILEFYRDAGALHRWRVRAENGQILAVSSEGYQRQRDAIRGADLTLGLTIREGVVQRSGEVTIEWL